MDIHDGNIFWDDSRQSYLYYGMGYTNCTEKRGIIPPLDCPGIYKSFGSCGFREDHSVRLYSSPNLADWTQESEDVLPQIGRPQGIYFRPKVVFNSRSKKYVLWINFLSPASSPLEAYPNASLIVAISDVPQGPFDVVTSKANIAESGAGDFTVFVDPNSSTERYAYIAYDAWGNDHRVVIERLNDAYTDSLGKNATTGAISSSGNEAPVLFERRGIYYLLFGPTCCFCKEGSGSRVFTANNLLGPWKDSGVDINPKRGIFGLEGRVIAAQENFVITIPSTSSSDLKYIYTGDRWGSAPDHLKSHDFQYWFPLRFNDSTVPPTISPLEWIDSFQLDMQQRG